MIASGRRRAARRAALILLGLALLLSSAVIAGARVSGVPDPNDVKGLMDIKEVEAVGRNRPKFLITTFARWGAKRIWDRGYGLVHLDARGDGRFEHYVLVYSDGGRMKALLYRDRKSKPDYVVAEVSAWKPSKNSVRVKVPLAKLIADEDRVAIRWFAKTLMTGGECTKVCIDRAPDKGALEHPIVEEPEPTPSPTPTIPLPTPSAPSPSPSSSPTSTQSP